MNRKFLHISFLFILFLAFNNNINAQTIKYVTINGAGNKDGSSWEHAFDNTGIQTAINQSATDIDYNMVWVANGTYYPTVIDGFIMKPGVKLYGGFAGDETDIMQRQNHGEGEINETILSGDLNRDNLRNSGDSYYVILFDTGNSYGNGTFSANTSEVNGFTITMSYTHAVKIYNNVNDRSSSPTISNNVITKNLSTGNEGSGIYLESYYNNIEPIFSNNTISNNNYGIYMFANSSYTTTFNPTIANNNINSNNMDGIFMYKVMLNNTIFNLTIENNIINNNNKNGIYLSINTSSTNITDNNTNISDNTIEGNSYSGIKCYVNTSNSSNSVTSTTIHGNFILNNNISSIESGGGISCMTSNNVFISHRLDITENIIEENSTDLYGGGIYCYGKIYGTISDNVITKNTSNIGGGISIETNMQTSAFDISNNTIYSNTAQTKGGSAFLKGNSNSNATFKRNIIRDNDAEEGGGIYCSANFNIINNYIYNNTAQYGGGVFFDAEEQVNLIKSYNNLVYNNYAENSGGGIYCKATAFDCLPEIINCVVTNNQAVVSGNGLCFYADQSGTQCIPKIANSIIWGGTSPIFIDTNGSGTVTPNITYSAIEGGFTGTENINLASINMDGPKFLLPTSFIGNAQTTADTLELQNPNWDVSVCSPCINSGDNSSVPSDLTTDFNDNPRIFGDAVDIGAYEFQSDILAVPITIQGAVNGCEGETITLEAVSEYSDFIWNDGSTNNIFAINQSGTYSVTVYDINNCTGTAEITVTFYEYPEFTISGQTSACEGESIILSIENDFDSYNWSTGQTSSNIEVSESGRYSVTVTQNNCSTEDYIDITLYELPSISISGNNETCIGNSISLSATGGLESYIWSTGQTTQNIEVSESGIYSVTVTDLNSCENTAEKVITVHDPTPSFNENEILCENEEATLSLSEEYISYLWSNGSTQESIIVNAAGIYSVTVTDLNGCTGNNEVTVTFHEIPATPVITKNDLTLTSNAAEGNQWYLNNIEIAGATEQTYIYTESGTYHVIVTSEFGCISAPSEEIQITVSVENHENAKIKLYPNPASEYIHIELEEFEKDMNIQIYNVSGQIIKQEKVLSEITKLNVSNFRSGTYFIKITYNNKVVNLRFIKE